MNVAGWYRFQKWVADLDKREAAFTFKVVKPQFVIPLIRPKKLEWKIGEPGADDVVVRNVRMLDALFEVRRKQCGNPFCKYPISALRLDTFATPDYGDVCATCHGLYGCVTMANGLLKNKSYFRELHFEWKREQEELAKKKKKWMDGGDGRFNA